MKKYLFIALSLFSLTAYSSPMTPEETLRTFFSTRLETARKVGAATQGTYKLAMRADNGALYAYNSGEGFILLDSEKGGLIGYGDTPLNVSDLPPALEAVIAAYSVSPLTVPLKVAEHDVIPVMMTTKWDQDRPYNNDCPMYNSDRSVTGCMATAMAQVFYHPSNRMQGKGTHTYTWSTGNRRLSFDYKSNPFDYDAMLDMYGSDASEEAKAAVANLMYGMGVACDMDYHPQMSGTSDLAAAVGMLRNLNCDKSLRLLNRDFYLDSEWDDMVYDQLATGHPLLYTGVSKDGGHAFVVDGYERQDDRNYYHINWGWSGNGDGYFELGRLNPTYLGIGGGNSMSGFNLLQAGFFNLKPNEGTKESQIDFWQFGTMMVSEITATRSESVDVSFVGSDVYNNGGCIFSGCLEGYNMIIGFKFINVTDGNVQYCDLTQNMYFGPGDGFDGFDMPCVLFPAEDGTYICKMAMKIGNQWYDVHEELANKGDLSVTITGNDLTFGFVDTGVRLRADFIGFTGEVVRDESTKLTVEFTAGKGDVDTDVIPTIITSAGKVLWTQSAQHLTLAYGETTTLEWDEPFTPANRRGSYLMTLQDSEGDNLITPFKVVIVNESGVEELEADAHEIKAEFFTLDGRRIDNIPAPGSVVIRKKGDISEKILTTY